jgi:hypothetical protein
MEGSNKDLARARFKQQKRDGFRDGRGRGRGGRGRGVAGSSPFDNDGGNEGDENENATPVFGPRGSRSRPEIDLPSDDDETRVTTDGTAVPPKSTGADLQTLFQECDQASLPRQHARTYLDPCWAVDDLAELERKMRAPGDVGDSGLDPAALQKLLRLLPLADLLGLAEDYREYMGKGEGSDEKTKTSASPESLTASGRAAGARHGKVDRAAEKAGGSIVVVDHSVSVKKKEPVKQDMEQEDDDELDALLSGDTNPNPTRGAEPAVAVSKREVQTVKPTAATNNFPNSARPAETNAKHDDDAFLDALLG